MSSPTAGPPVITSITFDQTAYLPGTTITATVNYTPGMQNSTQTFTGTATDSKNRTGTLAVSFSVLQAVATSATAADSGSRVWTKVSDSGGVAVFTATA